MNKIFLTLIMMAIIIKVGYSEQIGFTHLTYCGMPSNQSFSIKSSNSSYAVNLYYPSDTKTFEYSGKIFDIIKLTPNYIIIEKRK